MSCRSVQESAGWSWESGLPSPAPAVSATSSETTTASPSSAPGCETAAWTRRPSTATCAPSTGVSGAGASISSAAASPARISATLEGGKASARGTAAGSGLSSRASFAKWDPDTASWRTFQRCLDGEWDRFSETFPTSGSMRSGVCSARPTLERHTSASASSSWPTPQAQETGRSPEAHLAMRQGMDGGARGVSSLTVAVELWPTPKAAAANYGQPREDDRGDLQAATVLWGTPTTRDWRSGEASDETFEKNSRPLNEQVLRSDLWRTPTMRDHHPAGLANRTKHIPTYQLAHQVQDVSLPAPPTGTDGPPSSETRRTLNPLFVEWLQGFPAGWTACDALATPWCRWWQQMRSALSRLG
jgi:hypothetical protein